MQPGARRAACRAARLPTGARRPCPSARGSREQELEGRRACRPCRPRRPSGLTKLASDGQATRCNSRRGARPSGSSSATLRRRTAVHCHSRAETIGESNVSAMTIRHRPGDVIFRPDWPACGFRIIRRAGPGRAGWRRRLFARAGGPSETDRRARAIGLEFAIFSKTVRPLAWKLAPTRPLACLLQWATAVSAKASKPMPDDGRASVERRAQA